MRDLVPKALAWLLIATFALVVLAVAAAACRVIGWGLGW